MTAPDTPRLPPRFVPTLTEVVQPGPAEVREGAGPTVPLAALNEEQLVQRVMRRVQQGLDQRLREAVAQVVLAPWQFSSFNPGDPNLVLIQDTVAKQAGNIEPGRRRAGVSWSHHQQVAALDPQVADGLLEQAEREGWSKRDLAAAVKTVNVLDVDEAPDDPAPVKPLRLAMRVTADEANRADVEELLAAHVAQLSKQLARRKVTATVEVA